MSSSVELLIYEKGTAPTAQLVATIPVQGRTELGRQETTTELLYTPTWREQHGHWRVVIARGNEQTISRHHAIVELINDNQIQITNTGNKSTIQLEPGPSLGKDLPYETDLPSGGLVLRLGSTRVVRLHRRVVPVEPAAQWSLPQNTVGPQDFAKSRSRGSRLELPPDQAMNNEALVGWLQTALGLLQSAANSTDFFAQAAQAVVDLANMDSGRILLLEGAGWQEKAYARLEGSPVDPNWQPSQRVIDRVRAEKKTFWELPRLTSLGSVMGVSAVVAAPILDESGEVIGILYGDRRQVGTPISRVEAMLVELLSCGLASRLARLKEEQATLRLEQFFSPTFVRKLAQQPDLLEGRVATVTVLFCDIRNFTRFSQRLTPDVTVRWISDVMTELSECVIDFQGVLVDYIGDELMAMWGAPEAEPHHAQLACQASLAMLERLPILNERWQGILREPMAFGIGLNSGEAHVGNTGTLKKFKYGPLGNTVNVASRVQGATKHLRAKLLLTKDTFKALDPVLKERARRLCLVKLVGMDDVVELYELAQNHQPAWPDWKDRYEQGLGEFDRMNFRQAARTLQPLITEQINDGPSIVLMSRAVQGLANGPAPHHPVLEFHTK